MKGKRKAAANPALNGSPEGIKEDVGTHLQDVQNNDNLEDEEDEEEEEEGEEEEMEGEEEEGKEERPKLAEGFFEIEAIRRKRVRKGQLQYLIKWRGWPEAENTWEPLENLQSCSDVIDAFEESLQSGKSSRKRKRKHGILHAQPKKKQPRSSAGYNLSGRQASVVDKVLATSPPHYSTHVDLSTAQFMGSSHGENNGYGKNSSSLKQGDQNGSMCGPRQNLEKKDEIEYDPKLSELRGLVCSDGNGDELAVNFQKGKALQGDGFTNGFPKSSNGEPFQSDRRTGAKRRKSGSVKRFRKDPALGESIFSQSSLSNIPVESGGPNAQLGIGNPMVTGSSSIYKSINEDEKHPSVITKIIKPVSFSVSVVGDVQDVLVTFMAKRADGSEVILDNKFLKAQYPLLLIDFYEQHLRGYDDSKSWFMRDLKWRVFVGILSSFGMINVFLVNAKLTIIIGVVYFLNGKLRY